jgi:TPP-dependent 2-oxoacid decarboxylase
MTTVGTYLSLRLKELGMGSYFAIPGDYNLALLDELLKQKDLQMINCGNEPNAGYDLDGYARIKGVSALVVTFGVCALSAALHDAAKLLNSSTKPVIVAGSKIRPWNANKMVEKLNLASKYAL